MWETMKVTLYTMMPDMMGPMSFDYMAAEYAEAHPDEEFDDDNEDNYGYQ